VPSDRFHEWLSVWALEEVSELIEDDPEKPPAEDPWVKPKLSVTDPDMLPL
jgi:hypothetical protein